MTLDGPNRPKLSSRIVGALLAFMLLALLLIGMTLWLSWQIERGSEQRTFWLGASQLTLLALALIGAISLIFLMFSLIIEPVSRLHEGMVRIAQEHRHRIPGSRDPPRRRRHSRRALS